MPLTIIDYGLGNLLSVEKAFASLGIPAGVERDPATLAAAAGVVLPGVGAFGDGMAGLRRGGWIEPLKDAVRAGKPLLGICLGLQLLLERSAEAPDTAGLGLLPGEVRRFSGEQYGAGGLKVPHMGWNTVRFNRRFADGKATAPGTSENAEKATVPPLLRGVPDGAYVYFVHSYYVAPTREEDVLLRSEYGATFCAAAARENVFGVQFHPEKSQQVGLRLLENFAGISAEAEKARA